MIWESFTGVETGVNAESVFYAIRLPDYQRVRSISNSAEDELIPISVFDFEWRNNRRRISTVQNGNFNFREILTMGDV